MTQSRPESVPIAAAPWQLEGRAYIILVRLPHEQIKTGSFIPEETPLLGRGNIATLMFVDYSHSDVGPYHELLYIPGPLQIGKRRDLSITRIFVSTWASVINGENNWGIPKNRCNFTVEYGADGVDQIVLMADDGTRFAELSLQAKGPTLPASGQWLPKRWRTLSQLRDGQVYTYSPSASGRFRFARVRDWRFDARYFPDVAGGKVLAAVKLPHFRMTFPVAQVAPL